MISARSFGALVSVAVIVLGLSVTSSARADEECPLGSVSKSESGETWCEPTVCDDTAPCPGGMLCRPIPLCVEIGVLPQAPGSKSDAGQRLLVRQRCGADKSCPQRTTCSDKGRCITRAQADRANLLTVPGTQASASAGGFGTDAPSTKKACGCSVPGRSPSDLGGAAFALLLTAVIATRRRSRPADLR
jgi:hypothetical protein